MDYQKIIEEVKDTICREPAYGKPADYIPELSKIDPYKFGVHLQFTDDKIFSTGDFNEHFSIQSISKVFSLSLAYSILGEKIWERVDVEPSGDPFNSLVQLEYEKGIPRNPLINAGALVISDMLISELENPLEDFLAFVRKISGDPTINFDLKVAQSEWEHSWRNAALTNLMKSFGNIHNNVDEVLNFYFHQCALSMSCKQLAKAFLLFARRGLAPDHERILSISQSKRINAVMQTCGFYDEAGEFSFRVGLPGKSGVGGGIAAVLPGEYSIAVWSPRLNKNGNSCLGMKFLELFTTKTEYSVF